MEECRQARPTANFFSLSLKEEPQLKMRWWLARQVGMRHPPLLPACPFPSCNLLKSLIEVLFYAHPSGPSRPHPSPVILLPAHVANAHG
jgi:hypothetical protein